MTVKFYLDNPKKNDLEKKECPIYLVIRAGKPVKTYKFNTGKRVFSKNWDTKSKTKWVKTVSQHGLALDNWLWDLYDRIITRLQEEELTSGKLSPSTIKAVAGNLIQNLDYSADVAFFSALKEFIEVREKGIERQPKSGKPYSPGLIRHYKSFKNKLEEYRPNLEFTDITEQFRKDFEGHLFNDGKQRNTVGSQFKILKVFMKWAKGKKYHSTKAYKKFPVYTEETNNVYLTEDELTRVAKLDLSDNPRLDRVRDRFLIGCYTALRISDFKRIDLSHIRTDFIHIKTQKTGHYVVIPVHARVRAILDKYDNNLPPSISDQRFNDYTKEVCELAGIDEVIEKENSKGGGTNQEKYQKWQLVSSHTCRRSGATNMYLSGIPVIDIMNITGHKKESTFLNYIKASPEQRAMKLKNSAFFTGQSGTMTVTHSSQKQAS